MSLKKLLLLTLTMGLFSNLARADFVRLLPNDKDALQARADLIQQAKKEIFVEYFIMTDDTISTCGLALLREAAQRGVKVKIMVDGLFNSVKPEILATLLQDSKDAQGNQNIEIRLFKPANFLKPADYLHRDHTKLLNIDGEIMITGGRNVQNSYFGLDPKNNFVDLDVMVGGHIAAESKENFEQLWERKTDVKKPLLASYFPELLDRPCPVAQEYQHCEEHQARRKKQMASAREELDNLIRVMNSSHGPIHLHTGTNWLAGTQNFEDMHLLMDATDKPVGTNNQVISDELAKLVSNTQHSLLIATPYLIPTEENFKIFQELIKRNVHITIVTNSLISTDNLLAQAGYQSVKQRLIDMGIEIYEFNIHDTLHAKTAVIDGHILLVGSYNLDPRSANINREIMVEINDQENSAIGAELTSIINKFISQSLLVGKDGKNQNVELQNQGVSKAKKMKVKLLMLGLPLYKKQL